MARLMSLASNCQPWAGIWIRSERISEDLQARLTEATDSRAAEEPSTRLAADPEGKPLTYSWDVEGDGTFGDATGSTASYTYTTSASITRACGSPTTRARAIRRRSR